jgi:hypothetical protein
MITMEIEEAKETKEPKREVNMRHSKRLTAKPPTRLERGEKLRERIVGLKEELITGGFGSLLREPGPVQLTEEPDDDPKTEGKVGKVKETLGAYLQRVSVIDNFSQRPPFDHAKDPIYRRLIGDFIHGAAMPESKVAVLSRDAADRRAKSLNDRDTQFSIIDGLQRLYCYALAVLLVWRRETVIKDGLVPEDVWKDHFATEIAKLGDAKTATERLLKRPIRYEVFYDIDLAGLLHYMVTFNTAQRRMSLPVQLEIMRRPLIDELQNRAKVSVFSDIQKMPGMAKPKDQFAASDLILATEAFLTGNAQVTAAEEAEEFLNKESQAYLDNVGDIEDAVVTIKRIATELHPKIAEVYAGDPYKRWILSSVTTFLIGLCAACGYQRKRVNMKAVEGGIDKLLKELAKTVDDPMRFREYDEALALITTSRGKATRRLVNDTFSRFFSGATLELEWLDTVRQITGTIA